ncbi:uncharacterized protein J3R85_005228 [Psidium guajava]|nr:uncharacterized protein J3R85_005228 [Psidium guajava]
MEVSGNHTPFTTITIEHVELTQSATAVDPIHINPGRDKCVPFRPMYSNLVLSASNPPTATKANEVYWDDHLDFLACEFKRVVNNVKGEEEPGLDKVSPGIENWFCMICGFFWGPKLKGSALKRTIRRDLG